MTLFRSIAAAVAIASFGTAQAQTTFFEGFDDVATLASRGWQTWNLSEAPTGAGWFQGEPEAFGAPDPSHLTFAAVNYLNTVQGALSVWLVSPSIALSGNDMLSLSMASSGPWADGFRVHIADGSATTPGQFTTTILDIGNVPDLWLDFTPYLPQFSSNVRIAFEYYGSFQGSNYLGLDGVTVSAVPVPEPGAAALLSLGLAGLALRRRRAPRL